jgi:hypothetical protein
MFFTKINAIRFAEDFNILTQQQKTTWLECAYMQQFPNMFSGLTAEAKKAGMDAERAQVDTWKRQLSRVETARNRLYSLFIEVCLFLFCLPCHIPLLLNQF